LRGVIAPPLPGGKIHPFTPCELARSRPAERPSYRPIRLGVGLFNAQFLFTDLRLRPALACREVSAFFGQPAKCDVAHTSLLIGPASLPIVDSTAYAVRSTFLLILSPAPRGAFLRRPWNRSPRLELLCYGGTSRDFRKYAMIGVSPAPALGRGFSSRRNPFPALRIVES
jgi:hypothetical protein